MARRRGEAHVLFALRAHVQRTLKWSRQRRMCARTAPAKPAIIAREARVLMPAKPAGGQSVARGARSTRAQARIRSRASALATSSTNARVAFDAARGDRRDPAHAQRLHPYRASAMQAQRKRSAGANAMARTRERKRTDGGGYPRGGGARARRHRRSRVLKGGRPHRSGWLFATVRQDVPTPTTVPCTGEAVCRNSSPRTSNHPGGTSRGTPTHPTNNNGPPPP